MVQLLLPRSCDPKWPTFLVSNTEESKGHHYHFLLLLMLGCLDIPQQKMATSDSILSSEEDLSGCNSFLCKVRRSIFSLVDYVQHSNNDSAEII